MLWKELVDLESRDLYYVPGGSEHVPHGTFEFLKEDLDGTNPKFVVRDQDGQRWKAKLGNEARPETVASRIVWAVGYDMRLAALLFCASSTRSRAGNRRR